MHARSKPTPTLLGRRREREALDGLVEDLGSGHGWALVVRGEAGVGKSALLGYAVGAAADMRVTRAVGVESEMELAFAGASSAVRAAAGSPGAAAGSAARRARVAFGLSAGVRRTGSWSGWRC